MAFYVRRGLGLLLALCCLLSIAGAPSRAHGAGLEIAPDGFTAEMLDAGGEPETLAGSHPDRLRIGFALDLQGDTIRDLEFELPPGLGSNQGAVPPCPLEIYENEEECPPQSQVGTIALTLEGGSSTQFPLFELEAAPGELVAFGTKPSVDIPLVTEIRPTDFGVTLRASDLPEVEITAGTFELWGVPADHQEGTAIPRRALLTAPSRCGPLAFGFKVRSWQEGAAWLGASAETAPLVGCEQLGFNPSLGLQLSNPVADAPSGVRMELTMPEEAVDSERAEAQIENVVVELPPGIGVSPGGADGLVACSDAQVGLGNAADAACPPGSQVGTVALSSPALGGPLAGTLYLAEERPGQRFRVFVVVSGPGIMVKQVGAMQADPATGRLSTVLNGLPQIQVRSIAMSFEGGPRALLATPVACGPMAARASFEPYGGGARVESTATVSVAATPPGSPCLAPRFAPELITESSSSLAGHATTFVSTLRRRVGEQLPKRFSLALPAGLNPSFGQVRLCAAASAAATSCPAESKIGAVRAEIGSGGSTVTLAGDVHVTESYRRAPFGVLLALRAAIGPFNLGEVAIRGRADLDPRSGRALISMDDLPERFEGVPVRFREIEFSMDRPGFLRNPTSCAANGTEATLESHDGTLAKLHNPLELSRCGRLGFRPRIRMAFLDRGELRRGGRPGLRVSVRSRRSDANLRAMTLSLPPGLRFAIGGLSQICSRHDAADALCPAGSRLGTAHASSPMLQEPLRGSIYAARPRGDGLPDIWVSLNAMGTQMTLRGEASTRKGDLRIVLAGLPDVPISALTIKLAKGEAGSIALAVGPCVKHRARSFASTVTARGQNGARRSFDVPIAGKPRCAAGGA